LYSLSLGQPILSAPKSVTGTRNGDVTLQCIYIPSRDYSQVLVKWLVQHGSDPVTIFLSDASGDHIQQAKYRGRLKMIRKHPGDVSLQLNSVQMDDRSRYTCEVTWQSPDGNQVVRDEIIELRVQKSTTTVNSICDWTTKENRKLKETTVGRNLKVFLIIFIISLCCIVVVTTAYFMFCHRTFHQGEVFAKKTRNSEETTEVITFTNGYFNDEPDSHALINDYSDESLPGPGVLDNPGQR
ncbi:V-set and immunoglobulin domain-containing protein 4, partial [Lemmus lemmus]